MTTVGGIGGAGLHRRDVSSAAFGGNRITSSVAAVPPAYHSAVGGGGGADVNASLAAGDGGSGGFTTVSIPTAAAGTVGRDTAMAASAAALLTMSTLHEPVHTTVARRLSALVTLLLLQSMSQFVLEAYEGLISANMVIPLFLTMLVGAGGNAGNQAAVRSITGIATGEFTARSLGGVVRKEMLMGGVCAVALFVIGSFRVYLYYVGETDITTGLLATTVAISLSLFIIVWISVVVGAALPFIFLRVGVNAEHAAPAIQVLMDITGVLITCVVCSLFLPSSLPPPAVTVATP